MRFDNINILLILWILPAVVFFYFWFLRKNDRKLKSFFTNNTLINELTPSGASRIKKTRALLITLALALCIISLARPQYGFRWEDIKRKGVDIVIALDVSQSMEAADIDPTRLERAKRKIIDLTNMIQGDRIGLVAFAGSSFIQCPLTLDYGAFNIFLNALGPDLIPVPGTDISEAISTSIKAFDSKLNSSKAIILITDGEDHSNTAIEEAEKARKKDIKIFTIGIGSTEGVPIPDSGANGGFKKDENGKMVLTKLDDALLRKIAVSTGGSYVNSVSGDMDLKTIYIDGIRKSMKQMEFSSKREKKWNERFQWPLLAAIIFLFIEDSLERKKVNNKK